MVRITKARGVVVGVQTNISTESESHRLITVRVPVESMFDAVFRMGGVVEISEKRSAAKCQKTRE
jgi:hypothetical protein